MSELPKYFACVEKIVDQREFGYLPCKWPTWVRPPLFQCSGALLGVNPKQRPRSTQPEHCQVWHSPPNILKPNQRNKVSILEAESTLRL